MNASKQLISVQKLSELYFKVLMHDIHT